MDLANFGMVFSWTCGLGILALGLLLFYMGGPDLFRGIYLILTHLSIVTLSVVFIFLGLGIMSATADAPWWPSPTSMWSAPQLVYEGILVAANVVYTLLGLHVS